VPRLAVTGAAKMPTDIKLVTVSLAVVFRSMDIAAAVGAERLREIMTELVKSKSNAATVSHCRCGWA
jgi:hypothetical protein